MQNFALSYMKNSQKAVFTIAVGKPIYIQMAVNLARSFKHWHRNSSIRFVLATDQKHLIPPDLLDIEIIELELGQYGQGFSPKIHLDRIAPAEQNLFVDADCLCVGSLESVFDRFAGHAVSVVGKTISDGEFFGDVGEVCRQFKINELPKFVGGIYYFEKGPVSERVYATARELEPKYDQIGLVRLRNRPNEEPLMAIAMALHGQTPIPDDGTIKAEPMHYPSGVEADVFQGSASLWNLPQDTKYLSNWHLTEAHPLIVHFHCAYAERDPYTREVIKLEKVMANGWSLWAASAYASVTCSAPQAAFRLMKDTWRPIYRKLFGVRSVVKSQRIID